MALPRTVSISYTTCRLGNGKATHIISTSGRRPVCGKGSSRSQARSKGCSKIADVTCSSCQSYAAKYNIGG